MSKQIDLGTLQVVKLQAAEPQPDIAACSFCSWKGPVSHCREWEEGDYESGYYTIHECPICEDGGCIEDYSMSDKRASEWEEWRANTDIKGNKTASNDT